MAKGKKASGKTYVSKGERRSSMKTSDMHTTADRMLYKMDALIKGRDVYFTVANPNKNETNKRFIRQKVDGKLFVKRRQYAHMSPKDAE
jgi:hypothetical protein